MAQGRFGLIAGLVVIALSSCAVGLPDPPTAVTHSAATLHGRVGSNVAGETEYWFRHGPTTGYGSETPHRTLDISDDALRPVSERVGGLETGSTLHWSLCVQDQGENPPREICSKDQTLATLATSPFVTRDGTELRLAGEPYRFTGLNIYNANSRGECWYAMNSGSTLADALDDIGPGQEAFRAWFFQSLATTAGERDWSAFDHTLAVARAHGVKVIPTLTNQWGDCEAGGFKDEDWYATGYTETDPGGTTAYREWVQEVVTRYRDDPTILAWQLVNEAEVKPSRDAPECSVGAANMLGAFAADVAGLVKSIDEEHLVSLGTMGGGQCGAQGDEYSDVHDLASVDLCEYHDYQPAAPMPGDEFNGLAVRFDQCEALGKPLFIGEAGIKPSEVGGTFAARADAFQAKLDAQFDAGAVGYLAWAWSSLGSLPEDYDIGPGDPVLDVLALP